VFVALSNIQSACAVLYCHLWPVRLYRVFPHYLTTGAIFGKSEYETCVLIFSTTLSGNFLILRKLQQDIIICAHSLRLKYPLFLLDFHEIFLDIFSKNTQISYFMQIHPVGTELLNADGRTYMTKVIVAFRNFANGRKKSRSETGCASVIN
jgi:hypothetical protein